jgi:hypothetical protein
MPLGNPALRYDCNNLRHDGGPYQVRTEGQICDSATVPLKTSVVPPSKSFTCFKRA